MAIRSLCWMQRSCGCLSLTNSSGSSEHTPLPIRSIVDAHALSGGRYIVNGDHRTREAAGYPLHLIELRSGRIVRSFGSQDAELQRGQNSTQDRVMAAVRAGRVWIGHRYEYVLEQWDTTGQLHRRFRRNVDWFQLRTGSAGLSAADQPPRPILRRLFDADSLLWVVINVADSRWREAIRPRGTIGGMQVNRADETRYRDSIIDIVDLRTNALIVSIKLDELVHDITADGIPGHVPGSGVW